MFGAGHALSRHSCFNTCNRNRWQHNHCWPSYISISLYGSKTRRSEDDSVESKHVALISHYMFNITTVVFD